MIRKIIFIIVLLSGLQLLAGEHGIYLKLYSNINDDYSIVGDKLVDLLKSNEFDILSYRDVATPSIVTEKSGKQCSFKVKQILFTSNSYTEFLTGYGNKYLLAGFLKLSVYQDENGVQVNIVDPETINRIVFNDLYENDKEDVYEEVINKTKKFKEKLITLIHSLNLGAKVVAPLPPIRSDEDLMESSKDMFMMVGPMTFFNDEDQFPLIYKAKASSGKEGLSDLLHMFKNNLEKFKPSEDDKNYRLTKSGDVLKWRIVSTIFSPDSNAMLIGVTRPRTEGLSFYIGGSARESENNKCPGIDHAGAYPIEVLSVYEKGEIKVYTAREMFRMDMYFWDAGMMAFMDHMSMPDILDTSLRKALLNNKYQ